MKDRGEGLRDNFEASVEIEGMLYVDLEGLDAFDPFSPFHKVVDEGNDDEKVSQIMHIDGYSVVSCSTHQVTDSVSAQQVAILFSAQQEANCRDMGHIKEASQPIYDLEFKGNNPVVDNGMKGTSYMVKKLEAERLSAVSESVEPDALQTFIHKIEVAFLGGKMVNELKKVDRYDQPMFVVEYAKIPYVKTLLENKVHKDLEDKLIPIQSSTGTDFSNPAPMHVSRVIDVVHDQEV